MWYNNLCISVVLYGDYMSRDIQTHKVKSWLHLYKAAVQGFKKHDVRFVHERDYQVGDFLLLQEYDQNKQEYTGNETLMRITYITSNQHVPCALSSSGLTPDHCIISFEKV